MYLYVVLGILFLVFIGVSFYVITIYNKLCSYKNEVDKLWDSLRIAIMEQFKFVSVNIDSIENVDKYKLKDLIDKYMLLAYTEEIMNSYISLEIFMDGAASSKVKSLFINKNEQIDVFKQQYNNVLLKYNNIINMIPNKIIAIIFHFNEGVWFRSK